MTSKLIVNELAADTGISTITVGDNMSGVTFKTGTSNLHNVGIEIAGINVLGADTPIGAGATIYNSGDVIVGGAITATSFVGGLPITNGVDNRVITASSASAIQGEANLYFNGTSLSVGGSNVTDVNLLTLNGTGASTNVGLVFNKTNSPAKAHGIQVHNGTGDLVFYDYTASAERLRILSGGHLGVGDDNPDTRLSVKAASGTDVVGKFTSTDAKAWIQFRDNSTTDTGVMIGAEGDDLMLRAGSNERLRIKSNGQIVLGSDGTNSEITFTQDGTSGTQLNATTTGSGGYNTLSINSATFIHKYGSNERLRITSAGNVGIGTDNPTVNLHSYHATTNTVAKFESGDSSVNIRFKDGDTTNEMGIGALGNDFIVTAASGGERLRVTSGGQLQATGASDVRLTLGSSGTAGTNNSVHIRADAANLKFMAASGGSTLFETNGEEQFKLDSTGTRVCRRGVSFPNPNNTGSEITAAVFKLGSDNIQIQEKYPDGAYADRCDIVIRTNSGYGAGQSDKLRLAAGGSVYLAGRQYLTRSGVDPLAGRANIRENFFQAIAVGANHTFQIPNSYGGGLVYVVGSRYANANIQTTKIYAIAVRTTANAHLSSAIASVNGQSGSFSFTVTGASKGITVTNNDSTYSCNCFVTFDVTGFVG